MQIIRRIALAPAAFRRVLASVLALAAVVVIGSVASVTARTSSAWQDQVRYAAPATAGPNWVTTTCMPTKSVNAGASNATVNAQAVKINTLNISICVDTDTINSISTSANGSSVTLTMGTGSNTSRRVGALTVSGLAPGTWSVSVANAVQRRIVQPPASASTSLPPLHTGWVSTSTSGTYTLKLATATALSGIASPWAQYSFDSSSNGRVPDVSGHSNPLTLSGNYGTTQPLATVANGAGRSYLDVNGQNGGFATMPNGLLQNATTLSFIADVQISEATYWQRIFDFGVDTTSNMFLTTQGRNGNLQFAITLNGNPGESIIATNYAFPVGQWVNVKLTLQPNLDATTTGVLYVDGQEVGRNSAMLVAPSDLSNTTANYVGKSQYADPYLRGWIDSMAFSGSLN